MKKNTLFLTIAFFASALCANAEQYFFSPDGAGTKDASSWDNAGSTATLGSTLENLVEGDQVYMTVGKYTTDKGYWNIPTQGVFIQGGYPADMTGTETALDDHSQYSVFDGEKVNNVEALFRIGTANDFINDATNNTKTEKKYTSKEILDLPVTYIRGIHITNVYAKGGPSSNNYRGAAIFISRANVEFGYIKVDNCSVTANKGGVISVYGGRTVFHDAIFRNNKSFGAGMVIHYRRTANGSNTKNPENDNLHIINRCEFTDNVCRTTINSNATYGGVLAVADGGGKLYMVNCTVSGTEMWLAGAGIRVGGAATLYNISNTWYNCTTKYTGRAQGMIISVGTGGNLYSANSIVVNPKANELGTKDPFNFSMIQNQDLTNTFTTGGYNIFGSITQGEKVGDKYIENLSKLFFAPTDIYGQENTTETVFDDNVVSRAERKEVDGYIIREPLAKYRTTPLADLLKLEEEWNLPEGLGLDVDIRAKFRHQTTSPGAFASEALVVSGIENVTEEISDNEEEAVIYDINGRIVARGTNSFDFNTVAKGIYIVRIGSKAHKIIR